MSVTLTEIKDTQLINTAPTIIWNNFKAIKAWIETIENSYNVEAKKIQLIDGLTTPSGGISASSIQLKASSGTVFSVQNDTVVTFTLDSAGKLVANAISIASASDVVSEFQKIVIKKESAFEAPLLAKSTLDFRDINSKIQSKQTIVKVVPINVGTASTNKIALDKVGTRVFFDCYNNGNILGDNDGTAPIAIGVTDMLEGQEVEIFILRLNDNDIISFINSKPTGLLDGGGVPILEPLFAKIGVNGFEEVTFGSTYTHDNSTVGAFIKGIWMNIGDSSTIIWRFLVLETKGFSIA